MSPRTWLRPAGQAAPADTALSERLAPLDGAAKAVGHSRLARVLFWRGNEQPPPARSGPRRQRQVAPRARPVRAGEGEAHGEGHQAHRRARPQGSEAARSDGDGGRAERCADGDRRRRRRLAVLYRRRSGGPRLRLRAAPARHRQQLCPHAGHSARPRWRDRRDRDRQEAADRSWRGQRRLLRQCRLHGRFADYRGDGAAQPQALSRPRGLSGMGLMVPDALPAFQAVRRRRQREEDGLDDRGEDRQRPLPRRGRAGGNRPTCAAATSSFRR